MEMVVDAQVAKGVALLGSNPAWLGVYLVNIR